MFTLFLPLPPASGFMARRGRWNLALFHATSIRWRISNAKKQWDPIGAAMESGSYYKYPAIILCWFSSNTGYHHIHHPESRICNYRLKECYYAISVLQSRKPLTLQESLSCFRLKLWDEDLQKMIIFQRVIKSGRQLYRYNKVPHHY